MYRGGDYGNTRYKFKGKSLTYKFVSLLSEKSML